MKTIDKKQKENVLVVGVDFGDKSDIDIDSSMVELKKLVEAVGGQVVCSIVQKKNRIDPAYFIGKGKAIEIKKNCQKKDIDTVIFNDELSGAQIRNLENMIERKIIDRTNLILDIFAKRATTREGKLQIELAQLNYMLPRLVGYRDYLSREGGGIGTRGPGEQKLETDRRHILREINNIENELEDIERVRDIKRKRRINSNIPIVALVGYTNSGKSTLLNAIMKLGNNYNSEKQVFTYDMLFSTLDASFRKSILPNGQDFLVADTVGFVSKLPTHLVEAFKGTLEEVKYADLILHVVDASNKDLDIQIKTTLNILKELNVLDKPIITVYNKIDKIQLRNVTFKNISNQNKIFVSAKNGTNLDLLMQLIQEKLPYKYHKVKLFIPFEDQKVVANLFDDNGVKKMEYNEDGTIIYTILNSIDYNRYRRYIID